MTTMTTLALRAMPAVQPARVIDVVGWRNGKPYKGVQVKRDRTVMSSHLSLPADLTSAWPFTRRLVASMKAMGAPQPLSNARELNPEPAAEAYALECGNVMWGDNANPTKLPNSNCDLPKRSSE